MNNKLDEFARNELKELLKQLPEKSQNLFKRMYYTGKRNTPESDKIKTSIDEIVDNMPSDKLDLALTQVENTINKYDIN